MEFVFDGITNWVEKPELFGEISLKMYQVKHNIRFILDTLKEQYPNTPEIIEAHDKGEVEPYLERIVVDLSNASDEFYVESKDGKYIIPIEVVTKEVAEENDRELLSYYSEHLEQDKNDYKLGEVLSDYTRLGKTEYYFKFL